MNIKTISFIWLFSCSLWSSVFGNNTLYSFEGTIKKTIPISLNYTQNDQVIQGEIIYTKTKKKTPIQLLGKIQGEYIRLYEYSTNANITGILTFDTHTLKGDWYSPQIGKSFPLKLTQTNTPNIIPHSLISTLDPITTIGTYHYQYGPDGYIGDMDIKKSISGNYDFTISSVTHAPGRNIADLEGSFSTLTSNAFHYKIPNTDCEIKITFFKDFASIDYTNDQRECGFGHNATVEGIFKKIKAFPSFQCEPYKDTGDGGREKKCYYPNATLSDTYKAITKEQWNSQTDYERYYRSNLPSKSIVDNNDDILINYDYLTPNKLKITTSFPMGSNAEIILILDEQDKKTEVTYQIFPD